MNKGGTSSVEAGTNQTNCNNCEVILLSCTVLDEDDEDDYDGKNEDDGDGVVTLPSF